MKTKKVLALTVTAAMIASLGLAGCGNSKNNAGGSDAKTESKGDSDSVTLKWVSQGPGEDSWEGLTKPILEEYEKETESILMRNSILSMIYLKLLRQRQQPEIPILML